ncbi:MAG: hypothetical protein AAFS10_11785 [Myxococcota bacterium]
MSRIIQRRKQRQTSYRRARTTTLGQALQRTVQLFALVVGVLFLGVSPYLERVHHLRSLSRVEPDRWGPHLRALCSLDNGQQMLIRYAVELEEPRRTRLRKAFQKHGCPRSVDAALDQPTSDSP